MSDRTSDYELRHLRAFSELARTLHFGRAAAALNLSQSALSHQIAQLEQSIGAQLFDRTTRSVFLTTAGERLAEGLASVVSQLDDLVDDVHKVARGKRGTLRIASTGSLTFGLLPAALHTFRESHPDVEIRIRGELLTPAQVVALNRREIDVGLLRPPIVQAGGLVVEEIGTEPFSCVVAAGHPFASRASVTPEELADQPLVLYRSGSALRILADEMFAAVGRVVAPVVEVGETHTAISLVAGRVGVALVPSSISKLQIEGVAHVAVRTSVFLSVAIVRRAEAPSPIVEAFVDAVRAAMGGLERFALPSTAP